MTRAFLGPVEWIRELAGAVKADVQRVGSVIGRRVRSAGAG